MALYYIVTDYGCAIRAASTIEAARASARAEVGEAYCSCRKATPNDIEWVRGMGGRIPEDVLMMDPSKSLDITSPEGVEIVIRGDSKVVWVNVNGICMLRACRIKKLVLDDQREISE